MGDLNATVLAVGRVGGTSLVADDSDTNNFLLPNGTFFVVLIIFLIVLGVIGTFVVPPIMKVLRERENMVTKTAADNRKSAEQFAAARDDYEKEMAAARVQASSVRDNARAQGRKVLDDMRAGTEEQVASRMQDANEQLKRQGDALAADLRARVETMSATLAGRVLGVDISDTAAPAETAGR